MGYALGEMAQGRPARFGKPVTRLATDSRNAANPQKTVRLARDDHTARETRAYARGRKLFPDIRRCLWQRAIKSLQILRLTAGNSWKAHQVGKLHDTVARRPSGPRDRRIANR
jgi:hypothetical protein